VRDRLKFPHILTDSQLMSNHSHRVQKSNEPNVSRYTNIA
jgi:hypothetical protein